MEFDASDLTLQQAYKLMTGVVVPRPIAWVSTLNAEGKINLAPFSAFTFVSHDPPMIAISVGMRDGEIKDTARNILAREEFVVNVANLALLDAVHQSSGDYPPEVSEVDVLGLTVHPSRHIQTPRIAQAPAALECRLHQCLELGREPSRLIIGEVLRFHVRDGLARSTPDSTRPSSARTCGNRYRNAWRTTNKAPRPRPMPPTRACLPGNCRTSRAGV